MTPTTDLGWVMPAGLESAVRVGLLAAADLTHAVLRRAELLSLGVTNRQLDRSLDAHRWQEPAPGVVVLHNSALTEIQQQEVATRVGVELVALAARTAASAEGLNGFPAPALEVVVPKGTTYPSLPFPVKVHESRRFEPADIIPNRSPARVSLERAVIDAASWAKWMRVGVGLMAASVQQRLTTPERLLAQLDNSGQIRHGRLLRCALHDIGGGAQAVSEIDFLRFCRRNNLPRPLMQRVRYDASGRKRYLDATFRRADGRLISVEIDGALHLLALTYWNDMHRGNELVLANEAQLRFPSWMIHANDRTIVDQLRRALDLSVPQAQVPA